jgi:hypothetical protein
VAFLEGLAELIAQQILNDAAAGAGGGHGEAPGRQARKEED